jgi:predicted TIM-barrel fold metal-dependent hydrolase
MATTSAIGSAAPGPVDDLLISADSHVMEPGDLWTSRLPKGLRDQAPTFPSGASDQSKPGGWDPTERLKEMAVDGVSLEVLYATRGMTLFRIEDVTLQEACVRAFNDWLIEYCAVSPSRLFGVGLISLYNVDNAVAELERCRNAGLRGAMIWQNPPEDLPFSSDHYERFWAAAQDLQMPVSLHILTGHGYMQKAHLRQGTEHYRSSVNIKITEIMNSLFDLVFYQALDRFPRLKIVLVENEIGWIPFALQQWGYYLGRHRERESGPVPDKLPSEYLASQIYASFFNDEIGTRYLSSWGEDACMWSNDYPHANSTWPNSRKVIAEHLGHLTPETRTKVLSTNVSRLYNIEIPGRA